MSVTGRSGLSREDALANRAFEVRRLCRTRECGAAVPWFPSCCGPQQEGRGRRTLARGREQGPRSYRLTRLLQPRLSRGSAMRWHFLMELGSDPRHASADARPPSGPILAGVRWGRRRPRIVRAGGLGEAGWSQPPRSPDGDSGGGCCPHLHRSFPAEGGAPTPGQTPQAVNHQPPLTVNPPPGAIGVAGTVGLQSATRRREFAQGAGAILCVGVSWPAPYINVPPSLAWLRWSDPT